MARKRQPLPEFKRSRYFGPSEGWPYESQLSTCVLNAFPDANPTRLEEWQEELGNGAKAEPLLFMAMVCGINFRITPPDVTKARENLWTWLTGGDHYLDEELAEIVMEVLNPQVTKVVEARGYKRGWPKGEYVSKKGRPPASRGAWVAAFLVEKYLRDVGVKATPAKARAADLASVLLGRAYIELNEFYRIRKRAPKSNIAELTRILAEEYNHWVEQDKLYQSPEGQAHHETLRNVLLYMGYEGLCGTILGKIPQDLWDPFWEIQPAKPGRSKPAERKG